MTPDPNQPVTIYIYKPETQVARFHATIPGSSVMLTTVRLGEGFGPYNEARNLEAHELHCPYEPKWLAEHLTVVWKNIGDMLFKKLPEIYTVDRTSTELAEQVKSLNEVEAEVEEDDEEEEEAAE